MFLELKMNKCKNPNCANLPNQIWKIEFNEDFVISHKICEECANIIELSEFSNSSLFEIK